MRRFVTIFLLCFVAGCGGGYDVGAELAGCLSTARRLVLDAEFGVAARMAKSAGCLRMSASSP